MVDIEVVGFVGEHHQHHIAQAGLVNQPAVVPGDGGCGDVVNSAGINLLQPKV